MAVMTGTTFNACHMGVSTNPKNLLYKPMGDKLAGVVGMSNCAFVNCRFVQVGFTGSDDLLNDLAQMLLDARVSTKGGDAAS